MDSPGSNRSLARRKVVLATADAPAAEVLEQLFTAAGLTVTRESTVTALFQRLDTEPYDLAVVDLALSPDLSPVEQILDRTPEVRVVALTTTSAAQRGVDAVRLGAVDFIHTPPNADEVRHVLAKTLRMKDSEDDAPPASIRATAVTPLVGRSPALAELARTIRRVAGGVATILLRGETGTGKDLVARRIHEESPRAHGPFVKVDCGALPDNLLESELFGYEKGAFTGAVARKPGRVELAQGGTLFLDEIGEVTPALQVKLLRVLQDREYEPLGGTKTQKADVRFLAATHRDLEKMVAEGKFREDLFYRLNVVSLRLPPLRERKEDIEPLALHFCHELAKKNGRGALSFDVGALDALAVKPWPGNVRQLQNFIERLVVLSTGPRISAEDVERELSESIPGLGAVAPAPAAGGEESAVVYLDMAVMKAERRALEKALKSAKENRTAAARLLGISVRTLYYKLGQHDLG